MGGFCVRGFPGLYKCKIVRHFGQIGAIASFLLLEDVAREKYKI